MLETFEVSYVEVHFLSDLAQIGGEEPVGLDQSFGFAPD